jgi:CRP/FNR family transcriptional regulator, cyclic AMP receptor protein
VRTILSYCQGLPEVSFVPGETLLTEGDQTGVLFILSAGEVEVLKGDIQVNLITEPGAIIGDLSALLDIPHMATARAVMPSRAYVVERANEFLRSNSDITYQLALLLAQRLYNVTTYLADIKRQYADQQDHFAMVDEVLESLLHQQVEECTPGSDRDPDTTI